MRRYLVYLLPFFCYLPGFGQVETKEQFVNEILNQTSYYSKQTIFLSDTARGWEAFDMIDSASMMFPPLIDSIPGAVLSQIIANCSTSVSERWRGMPHIKVVKTNSRKFKKMVHGSFMYKRASLFVSNVVFDNSRNFAMIRIGSVCGQYCGASDIHFFKKVDGKWKLLLKTGHVFI